MPTNLQLNPGAESSVPEIVLTGAAERTTDEAQSGSYSVRLRSTAGPFGSQTSRAVWPDVTVSPGSNYMVRFWYNQDDPDTAKMRFRIDPGTGFTLALTFDYAAELNSSYGWQRTAWIEFTATGATASLEFSSDLTGSPLQDDWYIDDIELVAETEETMAIKLAERGVGALTTLLQDELGNELGLIDTERADGVTMAVPPSANYYNYPRDEVSHGTVHVEVFEGEIEFLNPYTDVDAQRAVYELNITVRVTHFNRDADTPTIMVKRAQRYSSGVFNVLNKNPLLKEADAAIQIGVASGVIPIWEFDQEGQEQMIAKTQIIIPVSLRCEEVQT